jgi:hypothetical protein
MGARGNPAILGYPAPPGYCYDDAYSYGYRYPTYGCDGLPAIVVLDIDTNQLTAAGHHDAFSRAPGA